MDGILHSDHDGNSSSPLGTSNILWIVANSIHYVVKDNGPVKKPMMNKTQEQIVKDRLAEVGEISRNWCLARYISRLSVIIFNLKAQGYVFEVERRDGDYVYKLSNGQLKML